MSRCDYDTVFYRVFCVTLLAVAFTFTLILTNVFIDIDGLLTKKRDKHKIITEREAVSEDFTLGPAINDDTSYRETYDSYRTKRSIETQNILFHIKTPKIKSILTNRLESLLDALDAEDIHSRKDGDQTAIDSTKGTATILEDHNDEEQKIRRQKEEEMLNLTVHNILLQGIIGHMDMKEVYKRVGDLMRKFNDRGGVKVNISNKKSSKNVSNDITKGFVTEHIGETDIADKNINDDNVGIKFGIDSRVGTKLEKQTRRMPLSKSQEVFQQIPGSKAAITSFGSNIFIKAIIDIKTSENKTNESNIKDNIRGNIEVIYNGNSMNFSQPGKDAIISSTKRPQTFMATKLTKSNNVSAESTTGSAPINIQHFKNIPELYLNRFVAEYFKHFPNNKKDSGEIKRIIETKRQKRHVKIKFRQEENKHPNSQQFKANEESRKKKEDDELYVEIETHFDNKGLKGEKKKKLIKKLIEKIQKAVLSGETKHPVEFSNDITNKKSHEQLHVRKRLQDPLKHKQEKTKYVSVNSIVHRQLDPITVSKTLTSGQYIPNARNKFGEAWQKEYIGPAFLAATKSINSAEMSELDVDFSRVLDLNGIPQRLQKPLNTDMSEETMNANSIYDVGNMKFFIKDIDGSGFSVGYNQYVDEPPDTEAIKLFTGLENVIKAYHKTYDEQTSDEKSDLIANVAVQEQQIPNTNDHIILRRSINEKHDYHSNEYKIIYDTQFIPYNNYKDIYDRKSSKTDLQTKGSKRTFKKPRLVIDDNVFNKNLKPSEIFSLANLFKRKKRSMNLKKISNINSKYKLNRYLNTKAMATKRIFLNKKRTKRQINKIRIIASDFPQKDSSDENIFVVSGENLFANRATLREIATTHEGEPDKLEETEFIPNQTEETDYPHYKIFDGKYRHNSLMSKYPHIFMEEITKSREMSEPIDAMVLSKLQTFSNAHTVNNYKDKDQSMTATTTSSEPIIDIKNLDLGEKSEQIQDIVHALQDPKANYKVTVKIVPKNVTGGLNGDFKEIHTSINKSLNKDGLIYSSLVNMSEISKVTKVSKNNITNEYNKITGNYLEKKIKRQQDKMNLLLQEHQKYIDQQLQRLNAEKNNIKSILVDNDNSTSPHYDYFGLGVPPKLHKILHLSNDELNKLSEVSLITEKPIITTITSTPTTRRKVSSTLTTRTTHTTPYPIFSDNLKRKILRKMESNEHLTVEILQKINKNTEILETFLRKLSDKIINCERELPKENINKTDGKSRKEDTPTTEHESRTIVTPTSGRDFRKSFNEIAETDTRKTDISISQRESMTEVKSEKPIANFDILPFPIDWRNHPLPFQPVNFRKNDSHMAIPFVYAYQHPLMPHQVNTPMASVVYHGHIHTNALHSNKDIQPEKEKIRVTKSVQLVHQTLDKGPTNNTRFFIDELGTDYKMIPVTGLNSYNVTVA